MIRSIASKIISAEEYIVVVALVLAGLAFGFSLNSDKVNTNHPVSNNYTDFQNSL